MGEKMTPKQRAETIVIPWETLPGHLIDERKAIAELRGHIAMAIHAAEIAAAVIAAQEEREACARIAESQCDVYNIGFCIASDIRARGDGP